MADFKSALQAISGGASPIKPFESTVTPIAAPNYANVDVDKMAANPAMSDYDRVMQAMIAEQRKKKLAGMQQQAQPTIGAPSWAGAAMNLMRGK